MPPITGVYTSAVALLTYSGCSDPRGCWCWVLDSSLGPVIAATIAPLVVAGDPETAVAYASVLALIVGAMTMAAGGSWPTRLRRRPSLPAHALGYMNGLALTILISQLPKLCGFSVDADGLLPEAAAFARGVANGEVVGIAVAVGAAALALILLCQRFLRMVPGVLVAVLLSIAAVRLLDLTSHGVSVVGAMPQDSRPDRAHGAGARSAPAARRSRRHRRGLTDRHHLDRERVRGARRG